LVRCHGKVGANVMSAEFCLVLGSFHLLVIVLVSADHPLLELWGGEIQNVFQWLPKEGIGLSQDVDELWML